MLEKPGTWTSPPTNTTAKVPRPDKPTLALLIWAGHSEESLFPVLLPLHSCFLLLWHKAHCECRTDCLSPACLYWASSDFSQRLVTLNTSWDQQSPQL